MYSRTTYLSGEVVLFKKEKVVLTSRMTDLELHDYLDIWDAKGGVVGQLSSVVLVNQN